MAFCDNLLIHLCLSFPMIPVIFFLLRLLKVADFQPRIALITRTINQALSELLNFGVLFMSLLIGYAIAGILLFGHQNAGFESLSPAILNLLIMLLAWDPYTWVQVLMSVAFISVFWLHLIISHIFLSVESCCSGLGCKHLYLVVAFLSIFRLGKRPQTFVIVHDHHLSESYYDL
jgi:hypothetical protein